MKVLKRVGSVLLLTVYLFTVMPLSAFAAESDGSKAEKPVSENSEMAELEEAESEVSESENSESEVPEVSETENSESVVPETSESEERGSEVPEASEEESADASESGEDPSETSENEDATAEELTDGVLGEFVSFDDSEQIDQGTSGVLKVAVKGKYENLTASQILNRINAIRKEACDQGVKNPTTGKPYTTADYKPLKWSTDMETIAMIRAVEASVYGGHERPNGGTPWTINSNGNTSSAENLAWNSTGIMQSIEQYYGEKSSYVTNTAGETGHYKALISNNYNYVGVAGFKKSAASMYPNTCSMEFSTRTDLSTAKTTISSSEADWTIEMNTAYLKAITLNNVGKAYKEAGSAAVTAYLTGDIQYDATKQRQLVDPKNFSGRLSGTAVTWSTSNKEVATVVDGTIKPIAFGEAEISASVGSLKKSTTIYVYPEGQLPYKLHIPNKTVYKVNEKLSLEGGYLSSIFFEKDTNLTTSMISGFSTKKAGTVPVSVKYDGFTFKYNILVLDTLKAEGEYGKKLSDVVLPTIPEGTFSWVNGNILLNFGVGVYNYEAIFTPKDSTVYQTARVQVEVTVYRYFDSAFTMEVADANCVYDGGLQMPVTNLKLNGKYLVQGTDYSVTYTQNKNAGEATALVHGLGYYKGTKAGKFTIHPATISIRAKDCKILIGAPIPTSYGYTVEGLCEGDTLTIEPTMICAITSTQEVGVYEIVPSGASAGKNYQEIVDYYVGCLTVGRENLEYTVSFAMQNHGEAMADMKNVFAGSTIVEPVVPTAEGYTFIGWYKDGEYKTLWDFEKDMVQSDVTLYAKWVKSSTTSDFKLTELGDFVYTGSAVKPIVTVYDGDTLMKLNKDYSVAYFNNVNVNPSGVYKSGMGIGADFKETLPYVKITGKGNYSQILCMNFNICPKEIGDAKQQATEGIKVKVNEQLVSSKGSQLTVLKSVSNKKTLKKDIDYTYTLTSVNAKDASGVVVAPDTLMADAKVPKGYSGSFLLSIYGIGNYSGLVEQTVNVQNKATLMKYVTVSLGKNQKSLTYTGSTMKLTPAYYDAKAKKYYAISGGEVTKTVVNAADVFTVRSGKDYLVYGRDFNVKYSNNIAVGTGTLTLVGKNGYSGSRDITFKIKGKPLSASKVLLPNLETNKTYTGSPVTQNGVNVKYKVDKYSIEDLTYGEDYTIQYKNNINKGTATMTFIGNPKGGYEGKFTKTFKILPISLTNELLVTRGSSMNSIQVEYVKSGAKPVEQIQLQRKDGKELRLNVDYTLSYKNNKAVAGPSANKVPMVTVKGKGNFIGKIEVPFTIVPKELNAENVVGTIAQLQYKPTANSTYEYKPSVKLVTGTETLKNKTDYVFTYKKNTQADVEAYLQKRAAGTDTLADRPQVEITQVDYSNYKIATPIVLYFNIFEMKMSSSNIYIVVDNADYTGSKCQPNVAVYYCSDPKVIKFANGSTDREQLLSLGMVELRKGQDYSVTYGTNIAAGKSTGSVTIEGCKGKYGGKMVKKFAILKKDLYW